MGTYVTVIERNPSLGDPTQGEINGAIATWQSDVREAGHVASPAFPTGIRVAADNTSIRCEGTYADE